MQAAELSPKRTWSAAQDAPVARHHLLLYSEQAGSDDVVHLSPQSWGHVAEWLRNGLQIRLLPFCPTPAHP